MSDIARLSTQERKTQIASVLYFNVLFTGDTEVKWAPQSLSETKVKYETLSLSQHICEKTVSPVTNTNMS